MTDPTMIFDLDGTLFHTEKVSVPAVREAFAAYGLEPPADREICACFGKRSGAYQAFLRGRRPVELADSVEQHALRREIDLIGESGELYPGIKDSLAKLRARAGFMAICSNGPRNYVTAVLAGFGITEHFDVVRYRVPEDCDKSQMLHDLLVEAGLKPGGSGGSGGLGVVVGDRYDDVESAHSNGFLSLGAGYGYGEEDELNEADTTIDDPRKLTETALMLLGSSD